MRVHSSATRIWLMSNSPIQDKFTKLKVSKQRRYQLRNRQNGKCEICAKNAVKWNLCNEHVNKAKKRYRCLTVAKERMEK